MKIDRPIRRGLLIAALYLLLAVLIKELGRHGVADAGLVERLLGVLLGALVVVYANAIPKALVPLARLSCEPAREQALRRFGGWALTLGGVGFMLAQALAPAGIANLLAVALLGSAVVAVVIAVARCAWSPRRVE